MRSSPILLILPIMAAASGCSPTQPPKTAVEASTQPAAIAPATAAAPVETPEQTQAIRDIEKWGGTVKRINDLPNGPVVEVDLYGKAVPLSVLQTLNILIQLQTLDVAGTQMTDDGLEYLSRLNRLKTLNLSGTDVTNAGMAYLRGFKQLQQLYLGDTKVTALGELEGLTKLQRLGLNGTQVPDAELVHLEGLTNLETLNLQHNLKLTDAALGHLRGLSQLQSLYVDHTSVSAQGVRKLQASLPSCKILFQR
jgi:hypothetical protein